MDTGPGGPRRPTPGSAAEATVPSRPRRNDSGELGLRAGPVSDGGHGPRGPEGRRAASRVCRARAIAQRTTRPNRCNQLAQWIPPPPKVAAGVSEANPDTKHTEPGGSGPARGRPCRSRPPVGSIPSHGSVHSSRGPEAESAISRKCLRTPTIDHDSIRVDGPSESFHPSRLPIRVLSSESTAHPGPSIRVDGSFELFRPSRQSIRVLRGQSA